MKKRAFVFAIGMGLLLNVMPVQADLIWEPMGDSFYTEHANECEYENRTYIAKLDKVVIYESPVSDEEVDVWEKGKAVYISFVYEDEGGNVWGIYDNGDVSQSGWVRMEHMALKYDSLAFSEEYAEQLVEEVVLVGNDAEMQVGFWTYPGAKVKNDVKIGEGGLTLHKTFTDEEGHKWADVGYFRAMKNYWVCVDAPDASYEELYPNGGPARGVLLEGTDIAVVDGTQNVPDSETANVQQSVVSKNEDGDNKGETSGVTGQETEKADTENTIDAEKSQVPFVITIIAGVVAVTGGLLACLKRSFRTKK